MLYRDARCPMATAVPRPRCSFPNTRLVRVSLAPHGQHVERSVCTHACRQGYASQCAPLAVHPSYARGIDAFHRARTRSAPRRCLRRTDETNGRGGCSSNADACAFGQCCLPMHHIPDPAAGLWHALSMASCGDDDCGPAPAACMPRRPLCSKCKVPMRSQPRGAAGADHSLLQSRPACASVREGTPCSECLVNGVTKRFKTNMSRCAVAMGDVLVVAYSGGTASTCARAVCRAEHPRPLMLSRSHVVAAAAAARR